MAEKQNNPQQALAVRMGTIKGQFESLISSGKLQEVVPKHVTAERLARVALMAISRNELVSQCTPSSLVLAFMEASRLGLEIGSTVAQAYLVPFFNKNVGGYEATFIPSYRGLQELARRGSRPYEVEGAVVREGDVFEIERGLCPKLVHIPRAKSDAKIIGAYAIARAVSETLNLPPKFEYMDADAIESHRKRSRASDKGPWVTDYEPMCIKTVVAVLCRRWLPMSPELADVMERPDPTDIIDVPASAYNAEISEETQAKVTARQQQAAQEKADKAAAKTAQEQAPPQEQQQPEPTPAPAETPKQQEKAPQQAAQGGQMFPDAEQPKPEPPKQPTQPVPSQPVGNGKSETLDAPTVQKIAQDTLKRLMEANPSEDRNAVRARVVATIQRIGGAASVAAVSASKLPELAKALREMLKPAKSDETDLSNWDVFYALMGEVAQDAKLDTKQFSAGMAAALKLAKCDKAPSMTLVDWRQKLLAAAKAGQFDWTTGEVIEGL